MNRWFNFGVFQLSFVTEPYSNNNIVSIDSNNNSSNNTEENSSGSNSANTVMPEILMWSYDKAPYNSLVVKQEQGFFAKLAFAAGMPKGFMEAFTFNLLVNNKADYDIKSGKFVLTIPYQYQKAGRKYALMGLNKNGQAIYFADEDLSDTTITTTLNIDGYAFMLIYSDGNNINIPNVSQVSSGEYTVKKGDTLSKLAKVFKTTINNLVNMNNIKDRDKIREGMTIKH